jgi:hypothetical protein
MRVAVVHSDHPKGRRLIRGVRQVAADFHVCTSSNECRHSAAKSRHGWCRVPFLAREGGRFGASWCNNRGVFKTQSRFRLCRQCAINCPPPELEIACIRGPFETIVRFEASRIFEDGMRRPSVAVSEKDEPARA